MMDQSIRLACINITVINTTKIKYLYWLCRLLYM